MSAEMDRPPSTMAAAQVESMLRRWRRRLQVRSACDATLLAVASASALAGIGLLMRHSPAVVVVVALAVGVAAGGVAGAVWWRRWTPSRTAREFERVHGGLDNLLVTAEELISRRHPTIHPEVCREVFEQAGRRARAIGAGRRDRLGSRLALATAATIAASVLMLATLRTPLETAPAAAVTPSPALSPAARDLRVSVTPPAYAGRPEATFVNPPGVHVLEGSRVRLEVDGSEGPVWLTAPGHEPVLFEARGALRSHEETMTASRVWLVSAGDGADRDRLLPIVVQPDRPPLVHVRAPARDLQFGEPRGTVPIELEADDDLGLSALSLRYTTVAGSGETFDFTEGELPLEVTRHSATAWHARGAIPLDALPLELGDTLVYRALVRDTRPGADPVASESFLIEIGRFGAAAASGFAIPEERDRTAISQQMVIAKTERLHAARGAMDREALLDQARLLAVEQRMVRAEFIFMTGGEVQDEVEEAEHSHELAEGRFENEGQRELLTAVREMSRAEARLNAGELTQALVFERAALAALQRAFDRRRYLLRTLPERTRIDLSRRASGDLGEARSPARAAGAAEEDASTQTIRTLMLDLASALDRPGPFDPALAARLIALDPQSVELQELALALSSDRAGVVARSGAADRARHYLLDVLQRHLAPPARPRLPLDPAAGHLADEWRRGRGRP